MEQKKKIALIYDFDCTLIKGNMQEGKLMELLGVTREQFWGCSNSIMKEYDTDGILAAMYAPIVLAKQNGINFNKSVLEDAGRSISTFYPGVEDWFDNINLYGKSLGVEVEHYIISAGYKEMVENCKIAHNFQKIFASSYMYDKNGCPIWPAYLVNYTQKTQYISRISKNLVDCLYDNKNINKKYEPEEVYIKYSDMIYFGDGATDVPGMKVVRENGGKSICVYEASSDKALNTAKTLVLDDRVDCAVLADYTLGGELDSRVRYYIKEIAER